MRSFADSDGDGMGDLRGLTSRLDYLNDGDPAAGDDLGVTGLWLMPVMESPSYHGYDVIDYRAVERDYGTVEDMRALVREAHARGIAVIVDFPINHTSREHPWFQDSRTRGSTHGDWYVWADANPRYGGPSGQRVWHQDGDRWYYGLFWEGMPDLNLENPAVTTELEGIARYWLTDLGVDGFRLDGAKHLVEQGERQGNTPATHEWLRAFHAAVHAIAPDALLVGEVWDATSVAAGYVPEDVDMVFEFGLAAAMRDAVRDERAGGLAVVQQDVAASYPRGGLGAFLTNHDMDRIATQLNGIPERLRLVASLLLTGPGTPFLYYGEEIGLQGGKPDERIRTPMPWDATQPAAGFSTAQPWEPLEADWRTVNVAAQAGDPTSLLSLYRSLIRFRDGHPALRRGDLVPVGSSSDAVDAVLRSTAGEQLLVLANVSDAPVSGVALDLVAGPLCGSPVAEVVTGEGTPTAPTISPAGGFAGYVPLAMIPARSIVVVRLRP